MKCPVRTSGKWVCSYVLADHIWEGRPMGPPAPLISAQERAVVPAAFSRGQRAGRTDPVPVPLPEITASSHVPATSDGGRNNSSSSSSNSNSTTTNGPSSSEFVPSNVGDVLPEQVVTRKHHLSRVIFPFPKALGLLFLPCTLGNRSLPPSHWSYYMPVVPPHCTKTKARNFAEQPKSPLSLDCVQPTFF